MPVNPLDRRLITIASESNKARLRKSLVPLLQTNIPLAAYTSWQIGGAAEYFAQPDSLSALQATLNYWETIAPTRPIHFFGRGANLLVRDGGVAGLVIRSVKCLQQLTALSKGVLYVEAGVSLARLLTVCCRLAYIEAAFMAGIPGSVGGALMMNAGAYGSYIWDYVVAVYTLNRSGSIQRRVKAEFIIGYRELHGLAVDEWFIAAELHFTVGDGHALQQRVLGYLRSRRQKQPLEYPSCGSVFRNPPGYHAAQLIEASGFKGVQIGGAQVSTKHANFIVNRGGATAQAVLILIATITAKVYQLHRIKLIPEVHIIGHD